MVYINSYKVVNLSPKRGKTERIKMTISLPKYVVDLLEDYANKKALPKGIVIQMALEKFFEDMKKNE